MKRLLLLFPDVTSLALIAARRASARDAVEITKQRAVAAGRPSANVGPYEKCSALPRFELDPKNPHSCGNRRPRQGPPRHARGMVEYYGRLLHPQDPVEVTKSQRRAVLRARQSRQQGLSSPFQLRGRQQRPHDRRSTPATASDAARPTRASANG